MRRRYILFKCSGNPQERVLLSRLKNLLMAPQAKIVFRDYPFILIRVDHLTWESLKRTYGPQIRISADTFELTSLFTSGTIRKAREKIKAIKAFSSHGDEEAVPVKSEGKDVE
ncbi:MAG: hypothetical protein ACUVQ5_02095 [Candidatus Methanomethylicaceae archaeon]